jgi:hypothetical protein
MSPSQTPQAQLAHKLTSEAIRKGRLVRRPCEVCGAQRTGKVRSVYAHHADYNDPLKVQWLCGRHHMRLHHKPRFFLTYREKTLSIKEWALRFGLNHTTLFNRIYRLKWPTELALMLSYQSMYSPLRRRLGRTVRAARECLEFLKKSDRLDAAKHRAGQN